MDKRAADRRKKSVEVKKERRTGPRRITCGCGGKIDIELTEVKNGEFICKRCGKKH